MNFGDEHVPRIPGATRTVVEWDSMFYAMRNGTHSVQVNPDGSVVLLIDSEHEAPRWMVKHEDLTNEVQRWFQWAHVPGSKWTSTIRRWVDKNAGPAPSVKNWLPGGDRGWSIGRHLQGNTTNLPSNEWAGSVFEWTHFVDANEDNGRDGLVVMWHEGGDVRSGYRPPEVWVGDVDGFLSYQLTGDPSTSVDVIERWNDRFENGIVWALLQMGFFSAPGRKKLPPSVKGLVKKRPELLSRARAG